MRDVISWAFTHQFFEPAHKAELKEFELAAREVDLTIEEYLSQLNVIQVFDTTKEVHKLKGLPVLILAGKEDVLIPTALSYELHKLIPGSEWKTVKRGHCYS
jgi:3-oxoadipate enol-lactonase